MDTRKTTELRAADGIKSSTIFDSVSLNADGKVAIALSKEDFANFVGSAFEVGERLTPACLVYHVIVDLEVPNAGPNNCIRYDDDCRAYGFINPADVASWVQKGIIAREKLNARQLEAIDAIRGDVNQSIGRQ